MKKIVAVVICVFALFCLKGFAEEISSASRNVKTKTVDVNKDGKADVTYYGDEKNVTKVEADTDYDGKPDVVVNVKDGKFESAEVDSDEDGTPEKKFSDVKDFNEWLNKDNAAFKDSLGWSDWQWNLMKF
ncbi:MAG: hypothetical protein KJ818_01675 [Candidatus Omnitrophica bacterium]|nr:hypothetical protein [Candidatus Omnitrophota bacterium]